MKTLALALVLCIVASRAQIGPLGARTTKYSPANFFQGYLTKMNRSSAERATRAAIAKSEQLNVKMNIAVVDSGANLVSFVRMDDAWLGSVDISIKKAKTATMFNMPTGDIGALSQPGGPLYNIEHSNNGLITFPGGVPVRNKEGKVVGAVGVSGSTVENDHAVAAAAVEAIA